MNQRILSEIKTAEFKFLNFILRFILMGIFSVSLWVMVMKGYSTYFGNFLQYPLGISNLEIVLLFTFVLFSVLALLYFLTKDCIRKTDFSTAKSYLIIGLFTFASYGLFLPPYINVNFAP